MNQELTKQVVIASVSLIVGLTPVVLQWLGNAAARKERATQVNNLRIELEFLDRWNALRTQARTGETPVEQTEPRLRDALDHLLKQYTTLIRISAEHATTSSHNASKHSPIRRALLLYQPETGLARLWHFLFYFFVVIFIVSVVMSLFNPTKDAAGHSEVPYVLLGAVIIYGLPSALMHYLARREDLRHAASPKPVAPPPASPPLGRRDALA